MLSSTQQTVLTQTSEVMYAKTDTDMFYMTYLFIFISYY